MSQQNRDYDACQRLVGLLSEKTGIAWTFGYLGNIYGTRQQDDDRMWYAFAAHPGRVGTDRDSIGGFRTENLDRLVEWLRGAVALAVVQAEPR